MHDVEISLRRDPVTITGKLKSLDANAEHADVEDVRVTGAGDTVTGSVRFGKDDVRLTANGDNVDLDALRHALGLPRGTLDGKASIHATLSTTHEVEKGHAEVTLKDATIGPVGGVTLALTGDLDDHAVSGKVDGSDRGTRLLHD